MGDDPLAALSPASRKRARDVGYLSRVASRVAEIVMVLSAMGQTRGGEAPTAAEKALAAEARQRLVGMCEGVKPKELFSREAVRIVAEDLGLNRSKDPALGFRPPKLSIADKLLLTKKKMEESKEINTQLSVYSHQHLPVSFVAKSNSRQSLAHDASRIMQDKRPVLTSAGGFQSAFPNAHVPVPNSAHSSLKQPHFTDVQSSVGPVRQAASLLERGSASAHIGFSARLNNPSYLAQVQVGHMPQKVPTVSPVQPTSAVASISQANKSLDHISVKSKGTGENAIQSSQQMTQNHETKPSVIQSGRVGLHIAHRPPQGLTFVHMPVILTSHDDIARSVQNILQPKVSDEPSCSTPSTKYMNATLDCQICKNAIIDAESLLVCDSCEKGNHLKCLQSYANEGITKAEWHCQGCLASSNEKPLLPKYGWVMRAPVGEPNTASNVSGIHASSGKRTQDLGCKFNGSSDVSQLAYCLNEEANHCEWTPGSRITGEKLQVVLPTIGVREVKRCNAIGGTHLKEIAWAVCTSPGMHSGNPNNIKNNRSSPTDIKRTTESVLQPTAVLENSHEHSHDVVVESDHLCEAPSAQDCDQVKLSSSSEASTNKLHENTKPGKSEPKEALGKQELSI